MGPEVWYPIEGYEGYYQVSSYGRVRSVDRTVQFRNGHTRHYTGKVLMLRYHNGYTTVNLNKNGQLREHYVHRLVAENFLLHFKGYEHKETCTGHPHAFWEGSRDTNWYVSWL